MGKKEVGQLGIIDLIVTILIAELATKSLDSKDASLLLSIIPITTILFLQVILSYITMKNNHIRHFIEGTPTVIIKNCKLMFHEMSKLRYSLEDLISQLREQGVRSIDEVNFAVLENNGKLSVFQKENEYPLPIIMDGEIDKDVLKDMNKNEEWIENILKKNNIKLENVFYAFYTKNKTYIIKKDELN